MTRSLFLPATIRELPSEPMSTATNRPTVVTPLTELRDFISESLARCRAKGWLGAAFRFNVAQDIATDLGKDLATVEREAHAAEVEDLEAAKILETAARDGLSQSDIPAVARAIRLIRRSAKRDHEIMEVAKA